MSNGSRKGLSMRHGVGDVVRIGRPAHFFRGVLIGLAILMVIWLVID